jgi:hypothetical protein
MDHFPGGAPKDYVRLRPERENDWHSSLTLALSLDHRALREDALGLEMAAMSTPAQPLGEGLAAWMWPRYASLSPGARRKWWPALFALASPDVEAGIGEDRWAWIATALGAAVEQEVKTRIFAPFVESQREQLKSQDTRWQHVLSGGGMLGELIECLLQTRQPQNAAAKRLAEWLGANQKALVGYLKKHSSRDLDDIRKSRGSALHQPQPSVPSDVRRLYEQATRLMDAIEVPSSDGLRPSA